MMNRSLEEKNVGLRWKGCGRGLLFRNIKIKGHVMISIMQLVINMYLGRTKFDLIHLCIIVTMFFKLAMTLC